MSLVDSAPFLFPVDKYDLISLTGLILTAVGLHMIYPPLALVIPGVLLMVVGAWGARP